jgi:hypothetical protein
VIFLADENFIRQAARLLEVFDPQNEVRHLTDCFETGTRDIEWIKAASEWEPRPVILGGDGRILRNKAERAALRTAHLSFVFLSSGWTNLPWSIFAWKIVKAWPDILASVERAGRPTIFEVKPGELKVARIGETAHL